MTNEEIQSKIDAITTQLVEDESLSDTKRASLRSKRSELRKVLPPPIMTKEEEEEAAKEKIYEGYRKRIRSGESFDSLVAASTPAEFHAIAEIDEELRKIDFISNNIAYLRFPGTWTYFSGGFWHTPLTDKSFRTMGHISMTSNDFDDWRCTANYLQVADLITEPPGRIDATIDLKTPILKNGERYLNQYQRGRVTPKKGDWPTIKWLLEGLVNNDSKSFTWLFNWLSFLFTHQNTQHHIAPYFITEEKRGKNLLNTIIRYCLGETSCGLYKDSNFDCSPKNAFVFFDEFFSEKGNEAQHNKIKKFIRSDVMTVEAKGVDIETIKSVSSCMFASNSRTSIGNLPPGDTRYCIFENPNTVTNEERKKMDGMFTSSGEFTSSIISEINAFAFDCLEVKWTSEMASEMRLGISNQIKTDITQASQDTFAAFWSRVVEDGADAVMTNYYPKEVSNNWFWESFEDIHLESFYAVYRQFTKNTTSGNCLNLTNFTHRLKSMDGVKKYNTGERRLWTGIPRKGIVIPEKVVLNGLGFPVMA